MRDILRANVRDTRRLANLTQVELAGRMEALGLGHDWRNTTVSDVENGRRAVAADELIALALALGTDPAGLLDPRGVTGRERTEVDLGRVALPGELIGAWLEHRGFLEAEWMAGVPAVEGFTFGLGDEPDSETSRFEVDREDEL